MVKTPFRSLAPGDKRDALVVAANQGKRRAYLLEKDVWVVETLRVLVEASFGRHLTSKGGTSLAKARRAVRRFSEDIDITCDIRAFAPDLADGADDEALPPTRSQEQRRTKAIRNRLVAWVREQALPTVEAGLARDGQTARVRAEGERLHIGYDPSFEDHGFVRPEVLVDFGARSTGEPRETRTIGCDAAGFLPNLSFPETHPAVVLAQRTFREKATFMRVFRLRRRGRGDRLSRHWHDVARLDEAGIWGRPSPTAPSPWRSRVTRPCSSGRRTPSALGSITRRRCRTASGRFPPDRRLLRLPTITPVCRPTACCLMMASLSRR